MLIVSQELLLSEDFDRVKISEILFLPKDGGDVYIGQSYKKTIKSQSGLKGALVLVNKSEKETQINKLIIKFDIVVLVHSINDKKFDIKDLGSFNLFAYLKNSDGEKVETEIQIIPIKEQIHSRIKGIYETDVLKEKTVLMLGVGSGGSTIAIELAKAGVGNFILIDPDRVEVVNMVRHVCGLSDLGRYKTKAVKDLMLDKNPYINITTYENELNWDWKKEFTAIAKKADLIYCGTDNRPSRVITNLTSLEENRTTIYAGTFRRAYGGQILRVIPHSSLCYQCFIDTFPLLAQDREISSEEQAARFEYSDRPVPVEPGLSSDILPISTMSVKLGILELLKGSNSSLKSLYDDLSSPLYQWVNRREIGTDYESLSPLDSEDGGYRILAWYGIDAEKNPGCPACGNFKGIYSSSQATAS